MKNIYFCISCETADDWGGFERFYGKEINDENSLVYYISMKGNKSTESYLNDAISAYFRLNAGEFFNIATKKGAFSDKGSIFFTEVNHAIKTCKKLIKKIEKKYPNKYNLIIEAQR